MAIFDLWQCSEKACLQKHKPNHLGKVIFAGVLVVTCPKPFPYYSISSTSYQHRSQCFRERLRSLRVMEDRQGQKSLTGTRVIWLSTHTVCLWPIKWLYLRLYSHMCTMVRWYISIQASHIMFNYEWCHNNTMLCTYANIKCYFCSWETLERYVMYIVQSF